jgi:predicted transcriptional regulator
MESHESVTTRELYQQRYNLSETEYRFLFDLVQAIEHPVTEADVARIVSAIKRYCPNLHGNRTS